MDSISSRYSISFLHSVLFSFIDSDQPLYLYPFLHPSHAQSQVVIHEADLQKFPKVSQARALEVCNSSIFPDLRMLFYR